MGTIACINIVYGALSAMAQTDLKYVIAYSSVSHMGVVMLGAATLTEVGLNGSVYQMFAHGVMTGLFFALVGLVYEKAHSREIFKMGGFARSMPGIATAFTIAGLSSLGLPGTAGFVAEFLTFLGAWQSSHSWWLFPAVIGAYLALTSPRSTCCASPSRSSGGRPRPIPTSSTCPTRAGRSGPRCGSWWR